MTIPSRTDISCRNDAYVVEWCLRGLLDLGIMKANARGHRRGGFYVLDDDLANWLELPEMEAEASVETVVQVLENYWQSIPAPDPERHVLGRNVRKIAHMLGLNEVEHDILLFAITIRHFSPLEEIMDNIGSVDINKVADTLSVVLRHPAHEILAALSPNGRLLDSGLMRIQDKYRSLDQVFQFISGFDRKLLIEANTSEELVDPYLITAEPATLLPSDFSHLGDQYRALKRYLTGVIKSRATGANILIYGPPGTGKTELVKTISTELGRQLFEIGIFSYDGGVMEPEGRLRSYQWAQAMLKKSGNAFVVFDEIEDIFPNLHPFSQRSSPAGKAWINRSLESNTTPTFWLSNAIQQLDNAMIRRFDLVIEISAPNEKTRQRLLREEAAPLGVSVAWIKKQARNERLVPAQMARAARVAQLSGLKGTRAEGCMEAQIAATHTAMHGKQHASKTVTYTSETPYDPVLSNTDTDLLRVISALGRSGEGRLCLYGPPGTGKTGFAYYLGKKLGKPVLAKPASQLLDMYVGQTEKRIAQAFKEASGKKAILLLDEADSLIHDRAGHQRSWETTQVNELLMQLERFRGIVIASTNLLEKVDSAAMRRFDFKIHFDYLKPDQAEAMFLKTLRQHGWRKAVSDAELQALRCITPLTPACFAVAARQARIYSEKMTPANLLETLAKESSMLDADANKRPIGFVH